MGYSSLTVYKNSSGWARRAASAGLDQALDLAAGSVVADDVEPRLHQVRRHRPAHDAQADEANGVDHYYRVSPHRGTGPAPVMGEVG
jgi:hypothetical protein